MKWNVAEVELGSAIAAALTSFSIRRAAPWQKRELGMFRKDADDLVKDIPQKADGQLVLGVVPVRHLFRLLGFDEHHPFQWRLEHKLVQALMLEHFCPGAIPATSGLIRYLLDHPDRANKENLQQDLALHYLKPALGSSSLHQNKTERDYAVDKILREQKEIPSGLIEESWIIQEKLAIVKEYRVHSLEDSVVEDLTYVNRLHRSSREERSGPNEFVKELLRRLPDAFVSGSLIGWDVAETEGGHYRVIETNWAGFHPVASRGFQCSGFFSQPVWGPYVTARLIEFIESRYGVEIAFENAADNDELGWIYWWTSQWKRMLEISETATGIDRSLEAFAKRSNVEIKAEYAEAEQLLSQLNGRFRRIVTMLD